MRTITVIVILILTAFLFSEQSFQFTEECPSDIDLKNINLSPFLSFQKPIFFVGNLNGSGNPEVYCRRSAGGSYHSIGPMIVIGNHAIKSNITAGQILNICNDGSGGDIDWIVVAEDKNGQKCEQGFFSSFTIKL